MITVTGKYTSAKIFTDNVEDEALALIYGLCNHPVFEGMPIRICPDVHAGKGIVIGFSCPIPGAVSPAHVGCDIGCSMTSLRLSGILNPKDYAEFEHKVKQVIPTGFNINEKGLDKTTEKLFFNFLSNEYNKARSAWPEMIPDVGRIDEAYISKMLKRIGMEESVFYKSLGTLGGGNHFLEYGEGDETGFFTIHCGSRNFGLKVFNYWNKISTNGKISKDEMKRMTEEVKASCTDKTQLKSLLNEAKKNLEKKFANGYLYNEQLRGYLSDMVIAQAYAKFNHKVISMRVEDILGKFNLHVVDTIYTTHNYIDFTDHIIRKGAINASEGRKLIIPFNMRDGLAICVGKGNTDWNCTAPHGAGRIMSRSAAVKNLDVETFENEMKDVYSTSVCRGTLDECPMAYKDTQEIISLINPTVDILFFVVPTINIKATDGAE